MALRPLITGARPNTGEPPGAPSWSRGYPTNAVPWFEDFFGVTVGTAVADDCWLQTAIAGTNVIGTLGGSTATGLLNLATGSSSGDGVILDLNGRTTAIAGSLGALNTLPGPSRFQARINFGTQTNVRAGFALLATSSATPGCALGTNWVTDPATTLAGLDAVVFHVDTAVASGALRCLYTDNSGTADETFTLRAAPVASTFYKIEGYIDPTADTLTLYLDGVAAATVIDISGWAGGNVRPSFAIQTAGAASRSMQVDYYYQAVGQTARR